MRVFEAQLIEILHSGRMTLIEAGKGRTKNMGKSIPAVMGELAHKGVSGWGKSLREASFLSQ